MESGVTCVVPARLGSTRFFGKPLSLLLGKPMIAHVLERAADAQCFDRIVCITDSDEIAGAASAAGFDFVMTSEAANGTERIARALPSLPGDLFVNLQGDEPAFPPEGLRALRDALLREPGSVHLLVQDGEPSPEELADPNRVKVVVDGEGAVRGFTRETPTSGKMIGAQGDAGVAPTVANGMKCRLQLGAYAYSRAYLERYLAAPVSDAERALSHEMLREPGLAPLRAHRSPVGGGASVDAPADLEPARRALEELFSQPQARLQGIAP